MFKDLWKLSRKNLFNKIGFFGTNFLKKRKLEKPDFFNLIQR